MGKTYDPKSYELAEHFLQDDPCAFNPIQFNKQCDSLAQAIQEAVENWFFERDG